ncbi:hypothetical protein XPA_003162 [Xanthoria parietina]
MAPMASSLSTTNSTDISPLPSPDRQSHIINIFFGLAAVVSSIIMIWQGRRMWRSWHDRMEPNTEVYELATHDIHRHESFAASPTSPQFGDTGSPMGSRDQHPHSTRLDGDNETAGDPAAADDSRRSTYRSLTT